MIWVREALEKPTSASSISALAQEMSPSSHPLHAVWIFVQLDPALRTVPFCCSAGYLSQVDTLQMEPFPITLLSVRQ